MDWRPGPSAPRTVIAIDFRLLTGTAWVASTSSTSVVPMPKATAPKAPWVEVWLSPQTTVMPGCTSPCSGATT